MNRRKIVEYSMSDATLLGKSEWKMTEPMMGLRFFTQATDSSFLGISRVSENRILEFDKEGNKIGGYGAWEKVKDRPDLNAHQLAELNGSFIKEMLMKDFLLEWDYTGIGLRFLTTETNPLSS